MSTALYQRSSRSASGFIGRCLFCRHLSDTTRLSSGHNRWSKIKHDKGKNDAQKNSQRSLLSKEIAYAAKAFGADPADNPRLAAAISEAKQAGFPKASIEVAIARGQGVTAAGKPLESMLIEAVVPPSVAVVIDCQTDSKLRTLQEVRATIKYHEGALSPIGYMFNKRGRITFEPDERGRTADDVLDEALEAGAEDIETTDDGNIVVYTEPSRTASVATELTTSLGLRLHCSEILWLPASDTMVEAPSEGTVRQLGEFVDDLQKEQGVQSVFMNIAQGSVNDDAWANFKSKIAL
ncbi:MAG: hypothetical protein M1815_005277 [Lichina confinis]|nr:MAG: hypothetical protein M1815_005277 [Lichina confinis]